MMVGAFGLITAVIIIVLMREPPRDVIEEKKDKEEVLEQHIATESGIDGTIKSIKQMAEDKSLGNIQEEREETESDLMASKTAAPQEGAADTSLMGKATAAIGIYCELFKILFSSGATCWLLLGSCLRVNFTNLMLFYIPPYFKVYPAEEELFPIINATAMTVGKFVTNTISGLVMTNCDHNPMTKPYLCAFKALVAIPCCSLIYL